MKSYYLIFIVWILPKLAYSQVDTIWSKEPKVSVFGMLDLFYAYDFNKPVEDKRQLFLYNYNRHNEFNLNVGLVKFAINHEKYHLNLSVQSGSYVVDNYASENKSIRLLNEANLGFSLNQKNSLWLDAGILNSHIGFEGINPFDNWTLTRSIVAENSPYYLTGAKLMYKTKNNSEFSVLLLNGWQHIKKIKGNSLPSFGTQFKKFFNNKLLLNYSTFWGSEFPDEFRKVRFYQDLYGQFKFNQNVELIVGFDLGVQNKLTKNKCLDTWFSPVLITKFSLTNKSSCSFRAEYFHDPNNIIISTDQLNGFKTTGLSLNYDYKPTTNVLLRVEGRWLKCENNIFLYNNQFIKTNYCITTSLCFKFYREFKL